MEIFKNLFELIKDQKKNISDLEKSVKDLSSMNYIQENDNLKKENEFLKEHYSDLKKKSGELEESNSSLKLALREQIIDEKLGIIRTSAGKLKTYFGKSKSRGISNLTAVEIEIRTGIQKLENRINSGLTHRRTELMDELSRLKTKHSEVFQEQMKILEKEYQAQLKSDSDRYAALEKEGVSEEVIEKRIRQNKLELKIGLNWLNKIAIFLFLMGMGVLARYSYTVWFNDYMKGSVFFAAGLCFIGAGEYFYRRSKDVFSKGLLGGGIGILYSALFYSYMLLHIVNLETALVILVIVTASAVLMSLRYKSETIGIISLAGGYLPFFTYTMNYDLTENTIYIAAGYVILLNVFLLAVSVRKQWRILLPVSYVLFAPTLSILSLHMEIFAAQIGFIALLFVLYTAAVLVYPFLYKTKLRMVEIIILGINIIINCSIVFAVFRLHEITDADGVISLIFALISFGIGSFVIKFINEEKSAALIFYVTALTFAVLMIPFQFGIKWASMGWLVESIVLVFAGYKNRQRYMEYAGWIIFTLCSLTFFLFDFTGYFLGTSELFTWKFTALALGSILITLMYSADIHKKEIAAYSLHWKAGLTVKYFTAFVFWIYLIVISNFFIKKAGSALSPEINSIYSIIDFYNILSVSVFSALAAYLFRNVRVIYDQVMRVLSLILYAFSILSVISVNFDHAVFSDSFSEAVPVKIISIGALVIINVLAFLIFRSLVLDIIRTSGKSLEIYPPAVAVYLLLQSTLIIIVQGDFSSENLIISFTYLLIAFASITYGFIRRFANIRLFGLGLTVFALAKLFIWDLRTLETGGKIMAYFGFGGVILVISFIYQKIKNIVDVPDVKK